jgi:hypothetical protein
MTVRITAIYTPIYAVSIIYLTSFLMMLKLHFIICVLTSTSTLGYSATKSFKLCEAFHCVYLVLLCTCYLAGTASDCDHVIIMYITMHNTMYTYKLSIV